MNAQQISPDIRVLVVDDDPLIRWAVAETLRGSGCAVVEVRDREGALRALTSVGDQFEVILLDYWLPDSDDLTLLTTVRRLRPDSQVVMMSAHATPEVAEQAQRLGAYSLLHKPFEMADVAPAVLQAHLNRPL